MTKRSYGLTSRIVHADRHFGAEQGSIHKPISTSVQFGYDRTEDLIEVFQRSPKNSFTYARQATPSTAALESLITALEDGTGSVCFSTGMAALSALFLTLLRAGDHVVSSAHIFGNTHSLFATLADLEIEVSKVDATTVPSVEAAMRTNTRMVFVETIANPGTQVPDLAGIGSLCQARGLLYVVDNTVTSPALFQPKVVGAGLVVNSLTKTFAGHGAALGGAVTDTGIFNWSIYPNIFAGYRNGDPRGWGLQQIRKKGLRDMGGSLAPDQAHKISLGVETMPLRVVRASETALALARFLEQHKSVEKVRYPMLASHPQHGRAKAMFGAESWLLSFELRDPSTMLPVLNRLRLAIKRRVLATAEPWLFRWLQPFFGRWAGLRAMHWGFATGLYGCQLVLRTRAMSLQTSMRH